MNRIAKKFIAGLLLSSLVFTVVTGCSTNSGTVSAISEKQTEGRKAEVLKSFPASSAPRIDGMDVASENENLVLYINKKTAEIAVRDRRNDKIWYSNPQGRENDPIANDTYKSLLNAQVSLSYYNEKDQEAIFNSFDESVKRGQFEIVPIKDGVKVIFNLSNYERGLGDIPEFMSQERFESMILDKLTDSNDKSLMNKRFKLLKEQGIYQRRSIPAFDVKKILDILDKVGYTAADLEKDTKENEVYQKEFGLKKVVINNERIEFKLSVEYYLESDNLVVNIPAKEIKYSKEYPLYSIKLLEYFGAADTKQTGYVFVPDGSGALIHLNNGKIKYPAVNISIYGQDYNIDSVQKTNFGMTSNLPVFGMKQNESAFVAIIENGEALSNINADISGKHHQYNMVSSEFIYLQKGYILLDEGYSKNLEFHPKPYQGDYRVRYAFLNTEEANYTGMARYYQKYLVEKKGLKKLDAKGETPFYLETVGAIEKNKSVFGFPVYSMEPLTTFKQAEKILDELNTEGINNIKLRYSGWFNGGLRHSFPVEIKVEDKLGGKKGLKELSEYAKSHGTELFPDVSFLNVYQAEKGFSLKNDAMRFLSQEVAKAYTYNPSTGLRMTSSPFISGIAFNYLLSPSRLGNVIDRFRNAYEEYSIEALSLRDLGVDIYSDATEKRVMTRQSTANVIEGQLEKLSGSLKSTMVELGNALTIPYARYIVNTSFENSSFNLEDESIPFLQIVLHGYKEYTGGPANFSEDYRRHLLKTVETGAGLYYKWIFADNSVVKETAFNDLYASNYKNWIAEATKLYQEMNETLKDVQDQPIKAHEKLQENVYKVTYENGKAIIVNYNTDSVKIGDLVIEGVNYKVAEGGN